MMEDVVGWKTYEGRGDEGRGKRDEGRCGIMNNDQMPQVLRYLMSSSTSSKDLSSDFDGITLVRT